MVMNDHKCAMGRCIRHWMCPQMLKTFTMNCPLYMEFLKLMDCGGFELLQVPEEGKNLNVIISSELDYTIIYLKARVHHGKIYIRPLQKDLCVV